MDNKAYLTTDYCGEGQFSNECAIVISNYKGQQASGFFPRKSVKENKLEVIIHQEAGDLVMVRVPGRFINGKEEAGSGNYITVKKEKLSPIN